ncbi:cytochrome P450 [Mycobacterium sp. 94-17]|uniref:cytochrome P450 n=1 Tax=Mycobacterium sp. 94-17 TaxID=2986147 RepID=UPI002D1F33C6|nr:cytochrome P450 [Mycobacterium sp. 94-17]MEB4209770.1 cytochrome P450 [Mycobacterium sp. 94-17]
MAMQPETLASRTEVDFSIYDPYSQSFVDDPVPVFRRMLTEFPVAYHTDINAWMISPHDLVTEALRDDRYTTAMTDWRLWQGPPAKPADQLNLFERVEALSMISLSGQRHQRIRRLTAPAFSRRVTDQIEHRIGEAVRGVFDAIEDPTEFNVPDAISTVVPIRAISALIGIPNDAKSMVEEVMAWNLVRVSNPMYAADRETFMTDALPGLNYLLDLIQQRRADRQPGDDFIGHLVSAEIDGDKLLDTEILAVLMSLVTAGADTAVDLHTVALYALLSHPEQRELLRQRPELMENTVLEVLRWSALGKFGGIPRFAREDFEFGGQPIAKGDFVMPLVAVALYDESHWQNPEIFDITRNQAGTPVFGVGPHLCIGLNLVKAQTKLVIEEFERRFGDSAELVGAVERDRMHFNSRRITTMKIRTSA